MEEPPRPPVDVVLVPAVRIEVQQVPPLPQVVLLQVRKNLEAPTGTLSPADLGNADGTVFRGEPPTLTAVRKVAVGVVVVVAGEGELFEESLWGNGRKAYGKGVRFTKQIDRMNRMLA